MNASQMIQASNGKSTIRGTFFGVEFIGTAVDHNVETTRGGAVSMKVDLDTEIVVFSTERKFIWIDERAINRGDHAISAQ